MTRPGAPMSDVISDPPRDPFANYEPKGVRFTSGGREWLLVQEPGYHFDGWLCRRHPDGQWVSMRKATDEDKATLAGVTTVAAPSSSAEPAPPTQPAVHLRTAFVTHIGTVTINNFGAVEFEANVQTPVGLVVREGQPAKVVVSADTIREIASIVRYAITDMKKEGVYER